MTYQIVPEFHASPEVHYVDAAGNRWSYPEIIFEYAIRRADGTLALRAETHHQAAQLMSNLRHPRRLEQAS